MPRLNSPRTIPVNQRIEHVSPRTPIDWRSNLLTYSEQLSDSSWTSTALVVSENTADVLDPRGSTRADKLTDSVGSTVHRVTKTITISSIVNNVHVIGSYVNCSCFMKQGTNQYGAIVLDGTGASSALFNLSTGTVAKFPAGAGNFAEISFVSDGWYRCSLTAKANNNSATYEIWIPKNDGSAYTYTGTGTTTLYVWGAQLVWKNEPSMYVQTMSAKLDSNVRSRIAP